MWYSSAGPKIKREGGGNEIGDGKESMNRGKDGAGRTKERMELGKRERKRK